MRWAALLSALLLARPALAVVPDPRFAETVPVMGLVAPTGLARAPDGSNRFFVLQNAGVIRIVKDGALLPQPFATLSPVYTHSECGLLGIAFDPDFITNQYVYVFVTVSASEQQIQRLTAVGDVGTELTLIVSGLPTIGVNHDGGALGFGPDGKLYWSIGDNGQALGVDQDLSTLASKVGRANRDGTVPTDNPFYDGPGPNEDRIWARGFRNPFTLSFEPRSGRFFSNTVGRLYEQVFVVERGAHAGWNDYENNQPAGYLTPIIVYRTNGVDVRTATSAVRAGGVLTVTTVPAHGFRRGGKIALAGLSDPSMNGEVFVRSVPAPDVFTALQAGPDGSGGGGTATTQDLGGAITGGTFYESTDFAPELIGDYFFGDYNSGNLMRAVLDDSGAVEQVDLFGTGFIRPVDVEVGPDGALWVLQIDGQMHRIADVTPGQKIVVSPRYVWMEEGGRGAFTVRLKQAPSTTISLDLTAIGEVLEAPATLRFNPGNWDRPQAVMLSSPLDEDAVAGSATVSVSGPGLATEPVRIRVRDASTQSLVLSARRVELREGAAGALSVSLAEAPPAEVTVTVSSTSASLRFTAGATLSFTVADYATPQEVRFEAQEDDDAVDGFARLDLVASAAPPSTAVVHIRDDEARAPVFTSTAPAEVLLGERLRYHAEASGAPAPSFTLELAPPGVLFDARSGQLEYLPLEVGSLRFVLRADNGVAPAAVQDFTVEVRRPAPPPPDAGLVDSGAPVVVPPSPVEESCACTSARTERRGAGLAWLALLALCLGRRRATC